MKTIEYNGVTYKEGDWVKLLRTIHGGYEIGDVYQIEQITSETNFTAKHKTENRVVHGFFIKCHCKAEPHEIPNTIINNYQIY